MRRKTETMGYVYAHSQDLWYLLPSAVGQLHLESFPFRLSCCPNDCAHSAEGDPCFSLGKLVGNWIKSVFKSFSCHTRNKAFEKSKSWNVDNRSLNVLWQLPFKPLSHSHPNTWAKEWGRTSGYNLMKHRRKKTTEAQTYIYFISTSTANIAAS